MVQDFEDCPELKGEMKRDLSIVMNKDLFYTPVTIMVLSRKWVIRGMNRIGHVFALRTYMTFRAFALCAQRQERKGYWWSDHCTSKLFPSIYQWQFLTREGESKQLWI